LKEFRKFGYFPFIRVGDSDGFDGESSFFLEVLSRTELDDLKDLLFVVEEGGAWTHQFASRFFGDCT
jgi:hypothetical protein